MAFKMNGFPSHKGAQQHVGTRKGSAVFQKHVPGNPKEGHPKEVKGETTTTRGDKEYGEWAVDPNNPNQELRTWSQPVEATTPYTPEGNEYYASLSDEEKRIADQKERDRLERLRTTDTGTDTRPIEQKKQEARGNLYRRSGTSNTRVFGTGESLGYTGSMKYNPDISYNLDEAVGSYVPEIYDESGKYQGQGEKVDFKDLEFYDDPEFQQLLTNVNFEMAVPARKAAMKGTDYSGIREARTSDYGKALKAIASADDKQAAYEKVKGMYPELVAENAGEQVNPLQNQGTGSFVTGSEAKNIASRGSGYKKLGGNRTKSWI